MRRELPDILRAYARDLELAGPQYAPMAHVLREAANELDPPRACPVPVVDDGIPTFGRPCLNCED